MKKSLMILSAMSLLPLGVAIAGPNCKTDCASKKKAAAVAKSDCAKAKCDKKATTVAKGECSKSDCDKAKCDEAALVSTECNFKCEKSVAKLFTSFDKDKDGKLCKAEFMTLVKATMTKQHEAKAATAAH